MYKVCKTLYGKKKLIPEEKIVDRPAVYGLAFDGTKILLVNTRSAGKFWFPGGGVNEDAQDASVEEALQREFWEETGIKVRVENLLAKVESYFYFDPKDIAFRQLASFYICSPISKNVTDKKNPDLQDEAFDPRWFEIKGINPDDFQDFGAEIFRLALEQKSINIA